MIILENLEFKIGVEHIKTLLTTKPCDSHIIIRHSYRVKHTTYFDYDLFKFAYPEDPKQAINRIECSYFLEHLLNWFGHSYTTQQKREKIRLWESITGKTLYSGGLLDSTVSRTRFFNIVGFFVYGNIYRNVVHKFENRKAEKLKMLTKLGEKCFYAIVEHLEAIYDDAYTNGGFLPKPLDNTKNETINSEFRARFEEFLATNPKITAEDKELKYSVFDLQPAFVSEYNAAYAYDINFLIIELLTALGYPEPATLNALRANVQISEDTDTISESKFYQLFGCCVLLAANQVGREFKLCELRRLGKSCFLRLLAHLRKP